MMLKERVYALTATAGCEIIFDIAEKMYYSALDSDIELKAVVSFCGQ